jgi:hypothetical protein
MADQDTEHLPRLIREQLGQIMVTLVGFADRLLLSALLIRIWGTESFEHWSAVLAFAGFGSLFEFGFNLYYNNKIMSETEQGRHEDAAKSLAEANMVMVMCALLGCLTMVAVAWSVQIVGTTDTHDGMLAAILLSASTAARLLIVGVSAQYRSNRAYARFANISATAELVRIAAVAAAVLAGADVLIAAIVASVAQLLMPVFFVLVDTTRRFPPHRIAFQIPRGGRLREALGMSGAYFGQLIPNILWLSFPILFLQSLSLATGAVAAFVLIRTLANLARTPLQSLGVVIGLECGRRIALSDQAGALAAFTGGARLFAVLGGLACGVVVFAGRDILAIWIGSAAMFDFPLAVAAMLPMLFGSSMILAHNVLVASNAPFLALAARWLQLALTILAYFVLPVSEPGLRVMAALAAGELLGYLPLAYVAVARLIPSIGFSFHLRYVLLSLFAAVFCGSLGALLFDPSAGGGPWTAMLKLLLLMVACAGFAFIFATDAVTRGRLIDNARRRVFGRVV